MTRRQEVLDALRAANGAWVDGSQLATAEVGGSEGLKRLREARADGWQIEERRHPDPRRSVWQYRLDPYAPDPASATANKPLAPARTWTAVVQGDRIAVGALVPNATVAPYRCHVCGAPVENVVDTGFDVVTGRCARTEACRKVKPPQQSWPKARGV